MKRRTFQGVAACLMQSLMIGKTWADEALPTGHRQRNVEGWRVRVDDRLFEAGNSELLARAMMFLENRLAEIKAVAPEKAVAKLQSVEIVLDRTHGGLKSMQYHPNAGWLKANGYSETLAKCVHLPRAADLPTKRNIREQPWVILHELAHAYHDQFLGFENEKIKSAYENYKKSGLGEKTLLFSGQRVKHYALTNQMEFFAEMTEAFFGFNDFYPFNRAEMLESVPGIVKLMAEIWGVENV